jgi:hypothetical protein
MPPEESKEEVEKVETTPAKEDPPAEEVKLPVEEPKTVETPVEEAKPWAGNHTVA